VTTLDDEEEASGASDRRDIDASLLGSATAFRRLMERYNSGVHGQMWRFSRDPLVVDELVQDVFVEVYQSLKTFRGDAPFVHWLRRIATRVGYRYWKQQARRRRIDESLHVQPDAVRPPEAMAPSEAAEQLHGILEQLAPKDRLVLTLMYFEECDSQEIAARMGWSATLVRVRAHRARQKLRALLKEAGYERRPS
jgi:RNA polymerase sigma-70 factor (ECF subfamily)